MRHKTNRNIEKKIPFISRLPLTYMLFSRLKAASFNSEKYEGKTPYKYKHNQSSIIHVFYYFLVITGAKRIYFIILPNGIYN